MSDGVGSKAPKPGGLLGSLRDALVAAGRDDTALAAARPAPQPVAATSSSPPVADTVHEPAPSRPLSAAEAAKEVRGVTSLPPPSVPTPNPHGQAINEERHMEYDGVNTTRIVRGGPKAAKAPEPTDDPARTQLVRGRQPLKRGQFVQDPVVGWLVIVGGPGLGTYRPIFEGNNTIGRSTSNRIPLDFGDEAISADEQAYIRYDSADRLFLFVPNLSKTNVVQLNSKKPTAAVELANMDVIVMGRTQLVFTPFCGPDFDWSEISESKD